MQKKNWIITLVFVTSFFSWITFDSLKKSVIFESGKEVALYETCEKSFIVNFEYLSTASEVVQNDNFDRGSVPWVELEKEEFFKKAPEEIVAVFKPILRSGFCSNCVGEIEVRVIFVKDNIMYFMSQKKEVTLPDISKFEKAEYVGNGDFRIYHRFDSSEVSYGGWFTFFRIVSFLTFFGSIGFWVVNNTTPNFDFDETIKHW